MSVFYDRQGNPITGQEFEELYTEAYKRIDQTRTGDVHVSTVWLGINYGFDREQPIIFETMIFGGECDGEMWRYSTEVEAQAGHDRVVAALEAGERP